MGMFGNCRNACVSLARLVAVSGLLLLACILFPPPVSASTKYLDPELAFKLSARMQDENTVELRYQIAKGYYMYRERFAFRALDASLGEPAIPPGTVKFDETFQKDMETFRDSVVITLPVQAGAPFTIIATSQGCADAGLCYSPMDSEVRLRPDGGAGLFGTVQAFLGNSELPALGAGANAAANTDMGRIAAALQNGSFLVIVPLFVLLGLGLAFTPCVLPMVPILSYIIVGEGARVSRARGLTLASTYALGMALVYTALGVSAGLLGEGLSAALQTPWVLATFGALLALLSLSMFGAFQFQAPALVQTWLLQFSQRQSGGKLAGVFAMGAISALIVGPCVAAPLAGALVYISQTRDVMVGGVALFALALGMSIPLLLVGLSAGTLLPRAGPWMVGVKRFFGVLLLGLALWMVAPLIPEWLQMLGWALLGLGYGAWLLLGRANLVPARALGVLIAVLGSVQLLGLATGGSDPWRPLAHWGGGIEQKHFTRIQTVAELEQTLLQGGKPVMLDFYADWCVSCKEMEKFTFTDARVSEYLDRMQLLQVDVTANTAADKALLKRFNLFGPPGIIFFDGQGQEIHQARVIGYQKPEQFLQALLQVDVAAADAAPVSDPAQDLPRQASK